MNCKRELGESQIDDGSSLSRSLMDFVTSDLIGVCIQKEFVGPGLSSIARNRLSTKDASVPTI